MGCACNKQAEIKENIQLLKEQRSIADKNTAEQKLAISFTHGCGDCVHFACLVQLYKQRGYEVKIRVEDNKRFIWQVAEVEITKENLPSHHWGYPGDFDNLNLPDWEKNKIAYNMNKAPLPFLGKPQELWEELIKVELDATPYINEDAREEARNFIGESPHPIVLLHAQGNTWTDRKNLPKEAITSLQNELLERNYSVVILDWDNRTPEVTSPRVKNIKSWCKISLDKLAALYEIADFLIGVDTCSLHFARFTQIPCMGIWRSLHPCRCSLPSIRMHNLVSANHYKHWRSREDLWNLLYYEGNEPTVKSIATAVDDILGRRDRCDKWLAGKYLYNRVGYDQRQLQFLEDHTIGEGSAGCEMYWLRAGDTLTIYGEKPTCNLKLVDDKWVGSWLDHERMPIELTPLDKSGLQWEKLPNQVDDIIKTQYEELFRSIKELQPNSVIQLGIGNGYASWTILEGWGKASILCIDEEGNNELIQHKEKISLLIADIVSIRRLPKCDLCYITYEVDEVTLLLASASANAIICEHFPEPEVQKTIKKFIDENPKLNGSSLGESMYLIQR